MATKTANAGASKRPAASDADSARESVSRPEFSKTASREPVTDVRSGGGKRGPKSALEGGQIGTAAGERYDSDKAQEYSVQVHSDEDVGSLKRGVQTIYVTAKSGDEAVQKVRDANKKNYGMSVRGVTPASDPDPNSLGGENMAAIMIANAKSGGEFAPIQTEANAEMVEKLGEEDVKDLGE